MVSLGLATFIITNQIEASTSQKVDSIVRKEMEVRHIPGAQVVVIHKGKIVYSKAFGRASLQFDVPVSKSTLFTINSATKSFTGVAIMQLVKKGLLKLDDPIGKYLSDIPEAWNQVTVREISSHVSGIPNIIDQSTGKIVGGLGEDAAWEKVQMLPIEFPANTKFSYNQTNYLLLGKIIDKLSGQPFVEYITQGQFERFGMKHSVFADSRDLVPNLAQSYWAEERGNQGLLYHPANSEFPKFLWTGAGICSTAEDIASWLIGLKANLVLVSPKLLSELWTDRPLKDGTKGKWAIGWPTSERVQHPWVGGIGGGRSAFFVYPQDELAVVALTNLAGGSPEQWIDSIAKQYVPAIP